MRVAIVDDDPVEHLILTELSQSYEPRVRIDSFTRLEDFLGSDPADFDIVFLDRCMPPHNAFSETLPKLQKSGYSGHVVLMTAHDNESRNDQFSFRITGPIDKLDLIRGEHLQQILATRPS